MADYEGYFPRNRAERVISAWRLFLAVLLTIAGVIDSTAPPEYVPLVQVVSFGYLTYSIGIALLTWTRRFTTRAVPVVTHVIDLVIFSALMFLTDGADSPFFPYFVFAAICGVIRWQGRGALLTGTAALVAYIVATLSGTDLLPARGFNAAEFLARCTQLGLVAGLLGYLGAYQYRLHREIRGLAAWPRRLPTHGPEALQEVLGYAATVLAAPRMVLVWEEGDEPSLRIAVRTGEEFEMSRQRPDAFDTLVAEPLARSSFVCNEAGTLGRRVLVRVPGGFRFWSGEPISAKFRQRYGVKSVVALRLSSDSIEGWLFVLDRPRASPDDLLLGDIVGRLVAGTLELQTLVDQLRESAAGEERVRLARELHDGVLQSLTAASLQAQRARQSAGALPPEAERRFAMVEETILAEQQALRLAIEDLKPGAIRETTAVDVVPRLREATMRVARQWDIRAHLNLQTDVPPVPQRTAHEITRMVQEALVNAVRHGGAREVTVTCLLMGMELALAVSYQGKGFVGFQGRHDLASLNQMKAGPRTLKERVSAVGGTLVIDSGERGARVEIRIPITPIR
ncbi:MAG TPA: sensor histidine kinase [Vicinamibacterales bacterium]|nr:sensor histidine kinase [Vicinamibacterales bacterium]